MKKKRGGRRPGAGAPRKHLGGRVAKNVSLSEAHLRLIEWWREAHELSSDSAAVANMIECAVFPNRRTNGRIPDPTPGALAVVGDQE